MVVIGKGARFVIKCLRVCMGLISTSSAFLAIAYHLMVYWRVYEI
jgi:hypothetical protein